MTEEHDLEPVGPWPWWAVVAVLSTTFIIGFVTAGALTMEEAKALSALGYSFCP